MLGVSSMTYRILGIQNALWMSFNCDKLFHEFMELSARHSHHAHKL